MQTAAGWWAFACVVALAGGACTPKKDNPDQAVTAQSTGAANGPDAPKSLRVESTAFKQSGEIPKKYTCEGEDAQPPLSFGGVPAQAKSLVLIVDDPDAPAGIWVHWVVYNMPPSTVRLEEAASLPAGAVAGVNDFGKPAWGGPCPPSGRHRYYFKLYALDAMLPTLDKATKAAVEKAMHGHVIARGELMGTYKKSG